MRAARPILVLSGAPGSGKTAAARLLAASAKRSVHLESDRLFESIAGGYVDPWKPAAHERTRP